MPSGLLIIPSMYFLMTTTQKKIWTKKNFFNLKKNFKKKSLLLYLAAVSVRQGKQSASKQKCSEITDTDLLPLLSF